MKRRLGVLVLLMGCACSTHRLATGSKGSSDASDGAQISRDGTSPVALDGVTSGPDLSSARPDLVADLPWDAPAVDRASLAPDASPDLAGLDAPDLGANTSPDQAADHLAGGFDSSADLAGCAALDECKCLTVTVCSPLAESCYCPTSCVPSMACKCGGGRFIGCTEANLNTCPAAAARVASLCADRRGSASIDSLCQRPSPECTTKCLNQLSSCEDLSCSLCQDCDCARDSFSLCYDRCLSGLRG